MKETVFNVSNVKCGGCVNRCETALKKLPSFESAQFDISANTVAVRGYLDPQAVIEVLTQAGYPASVVHF